jgi:glycerol uptake facilitator-like aquaporin
LQLPGAPIDLIFTVCDNAAGEVCPIWPGKPMTAHWGIADPAAVEGSDAEKAFAFRKALKELETRIKLLTSLPIDSLDRMTLQAKLREIGKTGTALSPPEMPYRALGAELLGSMLLAATVIGSGIMAERLAGGNLAVALLANTGATVAVLATLIALLGSHQRRTLQPRGVDRAGHPRQADYPAKRSLTSSCKSPAVVWAHSWRTRCSSCRLIQASLHLRTGMAQWLAEFVATFGLLLVILGHQRARDAPWMVAGWIGAAYWFTSSTSFANPAITIARSLSNTFAGSAPSHVPGFVLAQLLGHGFRIYGAIQICVSDPRSRCLLPFLKLGLTSFGGPIAHIGYFREEIVVRRRWIDDAAIHGSRRALSVPPWSRQQSGRYFLSG